MRLFLAALALLLATAVLSPLPASQIRVATLGGESRLLLDNTNLFAYPALATQFPHASFEIFDASAGLVLPAGGSNFVGLFFNRPTRQLDALNGYVATAGSPLFQQLDLDPWFDLMYARKLGERLDVGLAGRVAYDVIETNGRRSSARQSDLRLGLRFGTRDRSQVDAAIGVQLQDFRDTSTAGARLGQTDGTGVTGDLRWRQAVSEHLRLVHFIGIESSSYALSPQRRERLAVDVGTGVNYMPTRRLLVVGGLLVSRQNLEQRDPGSPVLEEDVLTLPAVHIGAEAQQGSIIFRLGMRHATEFVDREGAAAGTPTRTLESDFDIQLGLAFELGPVLLDGHLERDFLRDGPDFVGGSRHGGGILSRVTVTHRMGR